MNPNGQPQLLTEEECLEIIQKDFDYKDLSKIKLENFYIRNCSTELVGFMGEYYILDVEFKENTDKRIRSYFIKTLPVNNEIYRAECERKGFLIKEAIIYGQILPHIQRYAQKPLFPKAFLTRKDILVLEDFSKPEKRLKQLQNYEVYTVKHFQLFLEHLAELHAASMAWEIKEQVNIQQTFQYCLIELQLSTTNEWYTTGVEAILYLAENHPFYQYQEAQEFIKNNLKSILYNMEEYTNPSTTLHNVLCHRDAWDRNIFWELNNFDLPIACRMVDFQLTRYSPPAIDVLFFLYNNFENPLQRSQLLEELLIHYRQSLKNAFKRLALPENLITDEEFAQDCQRALLPVLIIRALSEPFIKLPKGWSQEMRATEPKTFDRYMNSERTEMFLRVSQIDATYMKTILLQIQEVLEYFNFKPKVL